MTLPTLHITNGPGQRDLELAFVGRNLGAAPEFTIIVDNAPLMVKLKLYNFAFVTCHGSKYKLGGRLLGIQTLNLPKLPRHNWIFVEYNAEERQGTMQFSNAE